MPTAHDSWADIYDVAYEQTFPGFLDHLTETTVNIVKKWQPAPARIVDFGAGTGRLAIPLAQSGYSVTAVDPSTKMLEVLTRKDGSAQVKTVNSTMQSFITQEPYDMALCVFTVIIYVLDQLPLENSLEAAANAVKPDGLILIDVPSRAIFNGVQIENKGFKRVSRVEVIDSYRYRYSDNIQIEIDGETRKYSDEFMIRYWPPDKIKTLFQKFGMIMISELERDFFGSGSNYFLFRKRN